ncbi:hypothetical protein [Faecalimicrobium dakarense]|uniref:hypothetical protein n=1 Tax=Faecalimicrobium dakarense TaxID=1301100 RepID=UPI0004AC89F1|nr:hypothetical protein [[Clostridium] dakarense]
MNININELEESLPKECCSFCTHLSLDGPNEDYQYNIKCIMLDALPESNKRCEFFSPENSNLTTEDLDNLYINYLEACIKVNYDNYLNSIHFKLFKEKALSHYNNKCVLCGCSDNLEVHHVNKKFGRESLDDVFVVCSDCITK